MKRPMEEEPKAEEAKTKRPKAEEPKAEEAKTEEPKTEEPKAEKPHQRRHMTEREMMLEWYVEQDALPKVPTERKACQEAHAKPMADKPKVEEPNHANPTTSLDWIAFGIVGSKAEEVQTTQRVVVSTPPRQRVVVTHSDAEEDEMEEKDGDEEQFGQQWFSFWTSRAEWEGKHAVDEDAWKEAYQIYHRNIEVAELEDMTRRREEEDEDRYFGWSATPLINATEEEEEEEAESESETSVTLTW